MTPERAAMLARRALDLACRALADAGAAEAKSVLQAAEPAILAGVDALAGGVLNEAAITGSVIDTATSVLAAAGLHAAIPWLASLAPLLLGSISDLLEHRSLTGASLGGLADLT